VGLLKTCTGCGEAKPLDRYSKDRTKKDGLQYRCKDCHLAYYHANRERILEYCRGYKEEHRESIRQKDLARQKKNLPKAAAARRLRRARQACAVPQRWRVHDIIPFACYWCGTNLRAYGATSHVDHAMPIALGGPATPDNEVMACAACNQSKSRKHPLVWIAEQF
jgi:hypothetical protein